MSETLLPTDASHLLQLCKLGKLFEAQDWIASGKSVCVPREIKRIPLEVAIASGFHSLVELLVSNEPSQELKNRALRCALSSKRLDLIDLLTSHGAEINSVPFIEVLMLWDPKIIRYFLDRGSDFIKNTPFAIAFGERIRTALGPWRECIEKYPDLAPQLQEQADRALRHFAFKEDLKWVSLLMWAGADPRSSGPTLDDDNLDESEYCSAVSAAAYCENVEILKRLRPDAEKDDIDRLLTIAAGGGRADVVRYLFELGAKPNDKSNGGSSGLDDCLERIPFESFMHSLSFTGYRDRSKASKYAISNTRATIQLLLEHGALWRPDGADQVARVRRRLLECEPDVTLELVERLMKHAACSNDTIRELLRTPTMKNHVTEMVRRFVGMGLDVRTTEQKAESKRQKTISHEWALRELASRYNRDAIYEEIWSEAIQKVAKRYNLSDVGLAKVCRKLKIPRPGRGYWAKIAAGKAVPKRPRLPALNG